MSAHQQTIYTIHESQLNNGSNVVAGGNGSQSNVGGGQRNSNTDILIDTSSIPLTQQTLPPMQHQHLQPTIANNSISNSGNECANGQSNDDECKQQQQFDTITSQPVGGATGGGGSSRVAPENQSVVYSVHPVFNMLDNHDALVVRQRADCTSTCCGFESANTYTVRSKDGSPVLKAIENSNCCERCCFEGNREYNLSLVHGDEVVARIRKPYRVSRFCCYSNAVRIESPEDNPVGFIRQMFTFFGHARYAIYDCQQPPKTPSFLLESTSCRYCCTPFLCTCICGNKEFRIISTETKEEIGTISRHWNGSTEGGDAGRSGSAGDDSGSGNNADEAEMRNDPDEPFNSGGIFDQSFGIQFVPNLEARHKVLLLSACFMMDFFYFENDRRRRKLASC